MGHEALAAISFATEEGDYVCGYYRDRAVANGTAQFGCTFNNEPLPVKLS